MSNTTPNTLPHFPSMARTSNKNAEVKVPTRKLPKIVKDVTKVQIYTTYSDWATVQNTQAGKES